MPSKRKILKPGVYEVKSKRKKTTPETILQYGWKMKKVKGKSKKPQSKKRSEFSKVMRGEKLPPWIPAFERWAQQTPEEVEAKIKKKIGAVVYELKHRLKTKPPSFGKWK